MTERQKENERYSSSFKMRGAPAVYNKKTLTRGQLSKVSSRGRGFTEAGELLPFTGGIGGHVKDLVGGGQSWRVEEASFSPQSAHHQCNSGWQT